MAKVIKAKIISHSYRDSVVLMELSRELLRQPDVKQAAAMMGTPANLTLLNESGLFSADIQQAASDDLVIVVEAKSTLASNRAIEKGIDLLEQGLSILHKRGAAGLVDAPSGASIPQVKNWREVPHRGQLAIISVPGDYAVAEAWLALKAGRHILLFSNHVSLEDELALKQAGLERGLLVMGAECGTSIINGIPLAFANQVKRGSIGLVAASGSGLQEVTCLIDRLGAGISHAIGTGGRDLSEVVGGLTMQAGIDLLLADPSTKILALLSKPPNHEVADKIIAKVRDARKPVLVCFLGAKANDFDTSGMHFAETLEELAIKAVNLSGNRVSANLLIQPVVQPTRIQNKDSLLRGLFAGGTLAFEAMLILQEKLGPIYSNAPLQAKYECGKNLNLDQHICLDLGAEEYTASMPHPMIDGRWRANFLAKIVQDKRVGVILFDLLLGFGSDQDPAGALSAEISKANEQADLEGRSLVFVCSITGTRQDIQNWDEQQRKLEQVGVLIAPSNAVAARISAALFVGEK
jgi:FdrA protein